MYLRWHKKSYRRALRSSSSSTMLTELDSVRPRSPAAARPLVWNRSSVLHHRRTCDTIDAHHNEEKQNRFDVQPSQSKERRKRWERPDRAAGKQAGRIRREAGITKFVFFFFARIFPTAKTGPPGPAFPLWKKFWLRFWRTGRSDCVVGLGQMMFNGESIM